MRLTRADALAMAKASCTFCHGFGMRPVLRASDVVCGCVWREVFRVVMRRFRACSRASYSVRCVQWDHCSGVTGYRAYSRPREEFCADVWLIAARVLLPADLRLFRLHYLLGADWRLCCPRLGIDRGNFFHRVYCVEELLGRSFAEVRPYPLYPLAAYFAGELRRGAAPLEGPGAELVA